jgi:branched-chain amino acid transport system ATP-binding protein
MEETENLLEIDALSRKFGGVTALDSVAMSVKEGELVSVIGPNGAGKTTLFNVLSGHESADSGKVRFQGRSILGMRPDRIAALGLGRTFQNGRIFANMSVIDNVLVGDHASYRARKQSGPLGAVAEILASIVKTPAFLRAEENRRAEAKVILSSFGDRLLPRRGDRAYALSYANRRRIELARALASKPRLLLLDEPTAGMNPVETAEMLEVIRSLKASGQTIVLIEHKLSLVMELSDRVYVLDEGEVISVGKPADVASDRKVIDAYLGSRPVPHRSDEGRSSVAAGKIDPDGGLARITVEPEPKPGAIPASGAAEDAGKAAGNGSGIGAPAASDGTGLVVEDMDTYYGAFQVHFKVSLAVPAGRIVCLLGGNASGKSTLMKAVLGLVKPKSGRIAFEGNDLGRLDTPAIVRLGIASVPEARRIFPAMTVRENLLMGAYTRKTGIAEDLERVLDLFPRLRERIGQAGGFLSGGEQQMLAIARALMSRPRLICMDEPTMGLSPRYVDLTLELIEKINRDGISVFMVEQNANLALEIAHYGFVIQGGRIVLEGPAADLAGNPAIRDAYLGQRAPE